MRWTFAACEFRVSPTGTVVTAWRSGRPAARAFGFGCAAAASTIVRSTASFWSPSSLKLPQRE